MPSEVVLIAGAGHAGGRCALLLRNRGFEGRIILVGDESYPPYERPPLSKGVLLETRSPEECFLVPESQYDELDIEYMARARVESIMPKSHTAQLDSGDSVQYDKLVLATGGICRRLNCQGSDLDGVLELRTLEDSLAIRERLITGANVVIVGGGFIGLECAASAASRGCNVHVVEMAENLLGRVLPEEAGNRLQRIHENAGVRFHMGRLVDRFDCEDRLTLAILSDGSEIAADIAIVGIGITPADRLAIDSGLEVENGIITDAFCRTSDPDVYAIGDCARSLNTRYGKRIRLESWQNAEQQAEIVAAHINGSEEPLRSVPWFWTDQYEYNTQMAGFHIHAEKTITRGALDQGPVLFLGIAGENLVSAVAIGEGTRAAKDLRLCQILIERKTPVDAELLADPELNLKGMLKR